MPDEPLYELIERMRRALQDAARVRARIEDRVKSLQIEDQTGKTSPAGTRDERKDTEDTQE
jgi:hypothetical protein